MRALEKPGKPIHVFPPFFILHYFFLPNPATHYLLHSLHSNNPFAGNVRFFYLSTRRKYISSCQITSHVHKDPGQWTGWSLYTPGRFVHILPTPFSTNPSHQLFPLTSRLSSLPTGLLSGQVSPPIDYKLLDLPTSLGQSHSIGTNTGKLLLSAWLTLSHFISRTLMFLVQCSSLSPTCPTTLLYVPLLFLIYLLFP